MIILQKPAAELHHLSAQMTPSKYMHRPSGGWLAFMKPRSCCSTRSSSLFATSAFPSGPDFSMRSCLASPNQESCSRVTQIYKLADMQHVLDCVGAHSLRCSPAR